MTTEEVDISDDCSAVNEEGCIHVSVRVRPMLPHELERGDRRSSISIHENSIQIHNHPFHFDHIFGDDAAQEEMFRFMGKSVVDFCLDGYNGTIFAYGQTSSGKTHTMQGPPAATERLMEHPDRGLIPRVLDYLFGRMARAQRMGNAEYLCKCQFLEIYNETISDLLDPSSTNLQIRADLARGIFVENLVEEVAATAAEAYELLLQGAANRHVGMTCMNKESSRSHSVFIITLQSKITEPHGIIVTRSSRLALVDLAGSERQKDTKADGATLREASNINKSLSALGNVIMALVDLANGKQRFVHYRDSKLTLLLKDSLGGNSKTSIVACVSPAQSCFSETLSTLRFAQRAKHVKNSAVVNENTTGNVQALQREVLRLRAELAGMLARNPEADPSLAGVTALAPSSSFEQLMARVLEESKAARERSQSVETDAVRRVEQMALLGKKKDSFLQSTRMVLKLREATLKRLESGLPISENKRFLCLQQEVAQLRWQVAHHPDVTRMHVANLELQARLDNYEKHYGPPAQSELYRAKAYAAQLEAELLQLLEDKQCLIDALQAQEDAAQDAEGAEDDEEMCIAMDGDDDEEEEEEEPLVDGTDADEANHETPMSPPTPQASMMSPASPRVPSPQSSPLVSSPMAPSPAKSPASPAPSPAASQRGTPAGPSGATPRRAMDMPPPSTRLLRRQTMMSPALLPSRRASLAPDRRCSVSRRQTRALLQAMAPPSHLDATLQLREHRHEINILTARLEECRTLRAEAEERHQEELGALRSQLTEARERATELETARLLQSEAEASSHTAATEALQARLLELEESLAQTRGESCALTEETQRLRNELERCQQAQTAKDKELANTATRHEAALQTLRHDHEAELLAVERALHDKATELDKVTAELEQSREQCEAATTEAEFSATQLNLQTEATSQAEKRIAELQSELEEATSRLAAEREQQERLASNREQAVEGLRGELEQSNTELRRFQEQHSALVDAHAALVSTRDALAAEAQEKTQQAQRLMKDLEDKQHGIVSLRRDLEDAREEVASLGAHAELQDERLSETHTRLQAALDDLDAVRLQNEALRTEAQQLTTSHETARTALASLSLAHGAATLGAEEAAAAFFCHCAKERAEWEAREQARKSQEATRTEELQSALCDSSQREDDTRKEAETLRCQLADLRITHTALQTTAGDLAAREREHADAVEQYRASLRKLSDKVRVLEVERAELAMQLAEHEAIREECRQLQEAAERADREVESRDARIAELAEQLEHSGAKQIEELETENEELHDSLQRSLQERDSLLTELKAESDDASQSRIALEVARREHHELNSSLAQVREELRKVNEVNNALIGHHNLKQKIKFHAKLKDQLNEMRNENTQLHRDLKHTMASTARYQSEVKRLRAAAGLPDINMDEERRLALLAEARQNELKELRRAHQDLQARADLLTKENCVLREQLSTAASARRRTTRRFSGLHHTSLAPHTGRPSGLQRTTSAPARVVEPATAPIATQHEGMRVRVVPDAGLQELADWGVSQEDIAEAQPQSVPNLGAETESDDDDDDVVFK